MTYDHQATYSPQDDKIRLFLGYRVDKAEWTRLKDAGFSWTMKQDSDLVALWTPSREDIALELCGEIGDEDQPREERSADRAERFSGYQEKREGEAVALADRYDAGPRIHGNQNQQRAERAAARHDRIAGAAVTQWSKAEYWTSRTAGVIAHALHLERPDVRHRRIKGLEADLRKAEKERAEAVKIFRLWERIAALTDAEDQTDKACRLAGAVCYGLDYQHPTNPDRKPASLWSLLREDQDAEQRITGAQAAALWLGCHQDPSTRVNRWADHLHLRLAYERQMLAAQGGTAADQAEMEAGGWLANRQIQKVTKDRAGRVSKVYFLMPDRYASEPGAERLYARKAEGITPGSYRAPTDEERTAFAAAKKQENAKKPKGPPLINPTLENAQRLQDSLNANARAFFDRHRMPNFVPAEVVQVTQSVYTHVSGQGSYAKAKTVELAANGLPANERGAVGAVVCRVRMGNGIQVYGADRVIVLTDQPQKPLPIAWPSPATSMPDAVAPVAPVAAVAVLTPTQETLFGEVAS